MGLTEPADVNDLVSMDTVEAPVVAIVDHEMLVFFFLESSFINHSTRRRPV